MSARQFVSFWVAGHYLGLPVEAVREVNRQVCVTPAYRTAPYVSGLMNLRGQIVTVFDLGVRLGLRPVEVTADCHNVILKAETVGLLVDSIGDVIEGTEEQVRPPLPNLGGLESVFVEGVLERAGEMLILLACDRLLDPTCGASGEALRAGHEERTMS